MTESEEERLKQAALIRGIRASPRPSVALGLADDTRIWRYMDLFKLLSIVEEKALFFPRADRLGDPHESALGKPNLDKLVASLQGLPRDQGNELIARYRGGLARRTQSVGVSCWHISPVESAAMWRLYAARGDGIAVSSTVERLAKSLQGCGRDTYLARLKYVDYATQEIPDDPLRSIWLKRSEFAHEAELRVVTPMSDREQVGSLFTETLTQLTVSLGASDDTGTPQWVIVDLTKTSVPGNVAGGIQVRCDPHVLIESIYVAPGTPGWQRKIIENVVRHGGLGAPVSSTALDLPRYDLI